MLSLQMRRLFRGLSQSKYATVEGVGGHDTGVHATGNMICDMSSINAGGVAARTKDCCAETALRTNAIYRSY